jgi:hypothetical protein
MKPRCVCFLVCLLGLVQAGAEGDRENNPLPSTAPPWALQLEAQIKKLKLQVKTLSSHDLLAKQEKENIEETEQMQKTLQKALSHTKDVAATVNEKKADLAHTWLAGQAPVPLHSRHRTGEIPSKTHGADVLKRCTHTLNAHEDFVSSRSMIGQLLSR